MKVMIRFKKQIVVGACLLCAIALCLMGGQLLSVKAGTDPLTVMPGASVRISSSESDYGIRFGGVLTEDLYDTLVSGTDYKEGAELGMMIVPANVLAGASEGTDYFTYFEETYGKRKENISAAVQVDQLTVSGSQY